METFMTKLKSIRAILKSDSFVLVTNKSNHASVSSFGHNIFWVEATRQFNALRKKSKEDYDSFVS